MLFDDTVSTDLILKETVPSHAKALGRKVSGFTESTWNSHKVQIMYDHCYCKFTQNKPLLYELLLTDGKTLIEAAKNDKIWGIGMGAAEARITPENKWKGQNLRNNIFDKINEYDTIENRCKFKLEYPFNQVWHYAENKKDKEKVLRQYKDFPQMCFS